MIRTLALGLRNIKDLHSLLGVVKYQALRGHEAYYPISYRQIGYYCNPKREDVQRYHSFTIAKRSGGERMISAPVAGLKSILMALNTILTAAYTPSPHTMGFVAGRSVVDNAKAHLGQNYIYNIDLEEFFPSIDKSRIWKRLTLPPFNYPSKLADIIAGLCTMRLESSDGTTRYVLPQGAPTSPIVSNIICEKLDRQLGGLARRFGLRYTRYADDITFSSMHYVYSEDGEFIAELRRIIADNHFTINPRKTRLERRGEHQEVTGLTLSDRVNVSRSYCRELRTILHIWEQYGRMAANISFMKHRRANPKQQLRLHMPSLDSVITGKLNYLRMVKGKDDRVYKSLATRYDRLLRRSPKGTTYRNEYRHIDYIGTMTRSEFESTVAKLEYTPGAYPKLHINQDGVVQQVAYSRSINIKMLFTDGYNDDELWSNYRVSLCYNGLSQFYLLHKRLVPPHFIRRKEKTTPKDATPSRRRTNILVDDGAVIHLQINDVKVEDIDKYVGSMAESQLLSEFAEQLDADVEVVKELTYSSQPSILHDLKIL